MTKLLQEESVHSLPREAKIVLIAIGLLEDLRKEGALEGEGFPLTERGEEFLDQLVLSDFKPTEEEVQDVIYFLLAGSNAIN